MLRTLVRENLVAFDAEWKPTFFSTNEVALIQLVIDLEEPSHGLTAKKSNFLLVILGDQATGVLGRCGSARYQSRRLESIGTADI